MDKITVTEIGIHLLGEMPVTCVTTHEGGMLVTDARYQVHSFTVAEVDQVREELSQVQQDPHPTLSQREREKTDSNPIPTVSEPNQPSPLTPLPSSGEGKSSPATPTGKPKKGK